MFGQERTELSGFYNSDMWPGVTNLVVSEMAKRSWSIFKVYLSNVAMELGRCTSFDDIRILPPTVVDDEVSLFQLSCCLANSGSIWDSMQLQLQITVRCRIPSDLFWSWKPWLVLPMRILRLYILLKEVLKGVRFGFLLRSPAKHKSPSSEKFGRILHSGRTTCPPTLTGANRAKLSHLTGISNCSVHFWKLSIGVSR
jgi:hypothetical protein